MARDILNREINPGDFVLVPKPAGYLRFGRVTKVNNSFERAPLISVKTVYMGQRWIREERRYTNTEPILSYQASGIRGTERKVFLISQHEVPPEFLDLLMSDRVKVQERIIT